MSFKPGLVFSFCLIFGLFTTSTLFAQSPIKNYETEWKQATEFIKKGLPKSALQKVKSIYSLAKKDNQSAQVIKALVYRVSLEAQVSDDAGKGSITQIEKELSSSNGPSRNILNSLLASTYWSYYQQNRWRLYNRTNTEAFRKDDLATWTATDFHKKISDLYLQSLKNTSLLQQTKLDNYSAIIIKGNMRHLRPTLFDLLAHQALMYFKNDEQDIVRPSYAFEINDAAAYDPAEDFIRHKFVTQDSLSLHQKALILFQELIAFHLNDAKPDGLIDVDLERIRFVNSYGVQNDKAEQYLAAITHIAHRYGDLPAAAEAWYMMASQLFTNGTLYQPHGDTTHRYDKIKAKEICEKVIAQKDSSEGKINCINLLTQINRKDLKFTIEHVNLPSQPFRALVKYTNVSTVYVRILAADQKLQDHLSQESYDDSFWQQIGNATPVQSLSQA